MANYRIPQQDKVKALFVAANPAMTSRLTLDEEIRAITMKIEAAEHRDALELTSVWAVRPDDLLQYLNKHKPQIVHFSGHGSQAGEIILVDDGGLAKPLRTQDIRMLFTVLQDNVRVVVLNACYSRPQAKAIVEVIDCAIGMNSAISGPAATIFAASFYRAIAFGRSVRAAFDQGKLALQFANIPEQHAPELLVKANVDPDKIFLILPIADRAVKEGRNFLMRARTDMLRKDYAAAIQALEKASEILSEVDASQDLARAKFLLALSRLKGQRPFVQTKSLMDSVDGLLSSAIKLQKSYAYIFAHAIFKLDFARNGLTRLAQEAQLLLYEANRMGPTTEDVDDLQLLATCQPDLIRDWINL